MFKFCPSCASEKITFTDNKLFHCPNCGFHLYHNTAAATACLISVTDPAIPGEQRILFLVRNKDPGKGKLDLPGGFVDPGEGAYECIYRELKEEIGWVPSIPVGSAVEFPAEPAEKTAGKPGTDLSGVFKLYASFPNLYPYKNIQYNTCDLFFFIEAPGLKEQDLRIEQSEISEVRFLRPEEIDYSEIAFESIKRGVRAFLNGFHSQSNCL